MKLCRENKNKTVFSRQQKKKRNRIRKANSLKRGKNRRKIPKVVGRVRKSNLRFRKSHKMERKIKKKMNKKNNLHHRLWKRMKNSLVRKKQKLF